MTRRTAAGILSALPSAHLLGAQQPAAELKPDIVANVNEVIVPITVVDDKGRFVSDLKPSDFKVFDEDKLQKLTYFNAERNQPIVIGFLLDLSSSSRLHWKNFKESARELMISLLPGDKKYSGYLISYSQDAELQSNTNWDVEKMLDKIERLKPGGGAALFDAIHIACTSRNLVKGEPIEPRRIIVIIGDGHDNASKRTMDEVLELAKRNLVTIYGMSTVAFGFNSEGEANLTRMTKETGGTVVYPLQGVYKDVSGYLSTPSDEGNYALKVGTGGYAAEIAQAMFRSVASINGEITTQYILRYVPDGIDDRRKYRKIRVEVGLPFVTVRYRDGYYPQNP
jgi:Ca-activated chloride channel homolog